MRVFQGGSIRVEFFTNVSDFIEFMVGHRLFDENFRLRYKRLIFRYREDAYATWVFDSFLGNIAVIKFRKRGNKKQWTYVEL